MENKNCKLGLFLIVSLGLVSIGWIDPLADRVREGNQLYHNGKYDEALDAYVNAQIDLPGMSQLDFNIADTQYKRGKYNEATQLFDKVIKSDDAGMRARSSFNMGNALYRQGKMKEALECYKKAVDFAEEVESSNLDTLKNDAKYNYEYVEKKMREEKQQQQNQDQKDQQQKEDPKKDDKQSDENKGEDKEKQKPPEDKGPSEPEDTQEKDENEKDKHPNQSEKDKQKDQPSEQQQQQQLQPQEQKQMSKEEAERLLEALNQSEKEARAVKRDAQRLQHGSVEKDW